MSIKQHVPWWVKIGVKIILSRIPFGYGIWQRLNLFKHGGMEQPQYALGVFTAHFSRANFADKHTGFHALEIGPGDTLFSAMIARAHGASCCWLVDVAQFAHRDIAPYKKMADELRARGLHAPDLGSSRSVDDVLSATGGRYLTDGVASWKAIPDASVDFIWSQAVLEHIRRKDFAATMREMRRVLSPGGVCSHRVDLQDHLNGGLNNLRFSAALWESDFMAHSGFYTNRINYSKMLGHFKAAGFSTEVIHVDRWSHLPTPRPKLAPEFRGISDDELLISSFDVILRPR